MEMSGHEKLLRDVTSTQYFAVLSTLGEGVPYSNLVSLAVSDDLRSLVFATGRSTRKYVNMQGNSNVSLLVDNRSNEPADISQAVAITAIGIALEETDEGRPFQTIFLNKHPHLKQFVEDPGTATMVVTVREYIIAGFDRTQRVAMSR